MPDSEQRIRDMVRAALEEDPRVKNKDLYARAREIDADAVKDLTLRQFHGRFRLPVSRAMAGGESGRKPRKQRRARSQPESKSQPQSQPQRESAAAADGSKHDVVRDIFRRFAVQLARAEGRAEIVRAMAGLDEFVDEVVQAFGGPDGPETPPPARKRRSRRSSRVDASGGVTAASAGSSTEPTASAAREPAVPERPARDMRRRRRPKAVVEAAQRQAQDAAPPPEPVALPHAAPPEEAAPPRAEPEPASVFSLEHDLEEFRRRRAERERARLVR